MELYNLGKVNWIESQSFYHALAYLGREALIICFPASPYICLGLHDDLEHEIDQEFCQAQGIPLLRRETGGGVVYLDHQQVFYQLVIRRDNPLLPLRRTRFYKKFLQPAISVYRDLGMPAEIKGPADLVVQGRKCSGNACGDIEQCTAYVGNLLISFDYSTMSKVLRVPNDYFRVYLDRAMRSNMTTLCDRGYTGIDYEKIARGLISGFEREFGLMNPGQIDDRLRETARELGDRLTSSDWLKMPGRRLSERRVKIAEGVYLMEKPTELDNDRIVLLKDGSEQEIILQEWAQVEAV